MPVKSVKARVGINLEYETDAMKILKRIDVKQPQHITLSGRHEILDEGHLIIRVKVDKQLYEELQQYCEEYT